MAREVVTELDDTLRHQVVATFDRAGVTDHRFMDRNRYMTVAPDGGLGLVMGLGSYLNMNVFDGYASLVVDRNRQLNTRVSRLLRPRIDEISAGPITITNVVPHRENRLEMAPHDGPVSFDLVFHAAEPPRLEAPHRTYDQGQPIEDYQRLSQRGTASGWISVDDRRWEVRDWYADKNHSWGVRSHFGGATIVRGGPPVDDFSGLFAWAGWSCGPYVGYLQIKEDANGVRRYVDGEIEIADGDGDGPRRVRLTEVEHAIAFVGNSNVFTSMPFDAVADSGEQFHVEVRPAHLPFAMVGTGYFDGFADRRGFGAYRGADVVEHDEYELFDDGWVRFPDGCRGQPWFREQSSVVECNGVRGFGYSCVLVEGRIEHYGLDLPKRNRQGSGIMWEDGVPDFAPGRNQGIAASTPVDQIPFT